MVAAYRARCAGHHVTVLEAHSGHGMDAHAFGIDGGLVDVPLRVMSPGTARVHQALKQWHRQRGRKVFYCGSWAYEGVPLLESAVRSANAVVAAINQGDAPPP